MGHRIFFWTCKHIVQGRERANGTYVTDGKNGDEYKVRKRGWTPDYIIIDENFIGGNNYEISMQTKFASLRTIVEAVTRGADILQTLQDHKQQILNDFRKMKEISAKAAQSTSSQNLQTFGHRLGILNGRISVHSSAAQQRNLVLLGRVILQRDPIENGGITSMPTSVPMNGRRSSVKQRWQ